MIYAAHSSVHHADMLALKTAVKCLSQTQDVLLLKNSPLCLQPIPASSHIICTASLDSIEGRKTWVRATVKDRPDGVEYAAGKALFVVPKKHPLNTSADGGAEEDRAHAAGKNGVQEESTVIMMANVSMAGSLQSCCLHLRFVLRTNIGSACNKP